MRIYRTARTRPAGKTVGDLAQALIDERAVLEACDWRDKAALRAWKAGSALKN